MRLVQVYEWWRPDDARLSDPFQKRVKHIDGFFHQWGVNVFEAAEGFGTFSVAIVELMDGTIITPAAELIQFMSPEEKQ